MRSLIALILAISGAYVCVIHVTINFDDRTYQSKPSPKSDSFSHSRSFYANKQPSNGNSKPKTHHFAAKTGHLFSKSVEIEGLTGQSTNTAVISHNAPELLKSYTVEDLVGVCAYDCNN